MNSSCVFCLAMSNKSFKYIYYTSTIGVCQYFSVR
nr:MAG TPA: hypothetical protein [Caudoviricetes sp.]